MIEYNINKNDEKMILALPSKAKYTNKYNDHKYINNTEDCTIKVQHNGKVYRLLSLIALETITLENDNVTCTFTDKKNNKTVINIPENTTELIETVQEQTSIKNTYIDYANNKDYNLHLADFINTVVIDILSNKEVLDELPASEIPVTPFIPVIDPSLAQNTITTQQIAEGSGDTQIPLGTTIIDQTNATYYKIALDEDQNLNVYKVTSNGEKTWVYTVNNQTEQETLNISWSRETDPETGDVSSIIDINSEMGLTPKQVADDTNFKQALIDYINLDNIYKLGHTVSILPNRGGGLINNFPMVHWNTNPTINFNAENSAAITIPLGNITWNTETNTSYNVIRTSNGGMNILRTNHNTGEHQLILPTQSTPPTNWTDTPSIKTSISREIDPETGDPMIVIGEWAYSEGNNYIGMVDDNELGQLLWDIYISDIYEYTKGIISG